VKRCRLCNRDFTDWGDVSDPAVQAGIILAKEKYSDVESICRNCLVSRGRLAMMYDPEVFD